MIWSVPKSLEFDDNFDLDVFNSTSFVGIRDIDKDKITNFCKAEFYNTALEFIYTKTMTRLHNTLKQLGNYNILRFYIIFEPASVSFLNGIYLLNSSCDLGLITSQEYKDLTRLVEFIQAIKFLDTNKKVSQKEFLYFLKVCCQSVFAKDYKDFVTSYINFATSLHTQELLPLSQIYIDIIESDVRKIIVVMQLLCMLVVEKFNDVLDKNISVIVPAISNNFTNGQRLIFSYFLKDYKNYADKYIKLADIVGEVKAFEKLYTKCKEINYLHYDVSGYSIETSVLNNLLDNIMVTNDYSILVIPLLILAYVGNDYAINVNSRIIAEKYINTITIDRWNNYFKNYFFDNFYLLVSLFDSKTKIKSLCDMILYIYIDEEVPNIGIVKYGLDKDYKSISELISKKFLR